MSLVKIAFRNILRNRRRSITTGVAVAIGAVSILLLGAFFARNIVGLQTSTVWRTGHLTVFRAGYFDFGSGNPGAYSIGNYQTVMDMIWNDPVMGPMINVITPTVKLYGIAGSPDHDASKSFMGEGFLPADADRMQKWDEYGILTDFGASLQQKNSGLNDSDITQGITGRGMARILGLCQSLGMADCPAPPQTEDTAPGKVDGARAHDFSDLISQNTDIGNHGKANAKPRLNLLAATVGGAPNVVTLDVGRAEFIPLKELDDMYVGMHLKLAQQLLYGRGEPKVTGVVIQLHRTEEMGAARDRLAELFKSRGLDLDVHDFTELTSLYNQAVGFYKAIFAFVGVIMGLIVLFTVTNTMGMSVMERISEIGTSRAMGLRRQGVRNQFLVEGLLLGMMGACVGVVCAAIIATLFNAAHLTWTPPSVSAPIPLDLMMSALWTAALPTWAALSSIATIAAYIPANRAARMTVVDALRHV